MTPDTDSGLDVMQVCRNGHVITDRLRSDPESGRSHCDRCGAATLYHCSTCGRELPGAGHVPGLVPIGAWPAPRHCPTCGAVFPWARHPRPTRDAQALLEALLRRLPLTIRQLRWRQGDRRPYLVEDERDLEDLLRALLPLHFDDVRLESRTPRYSACTRTDLLLAPQKMSLTVKRARPSLREPQLAEQAQEDAAYYQARGGCRTLIIFIYDPEGLLRDRQTLQPAASELERDLDVRYILAAPAVTTAEPAGP
jgi:REase_DpnII-MboI/Uncharacterized protein conserved in bacteria (DUF2321)